MRNYNYVVFNGKDNNQLRKNPDGYYTICAKDLEGLDDVCLVSYPVDHAPTFIRFLFGVHHTERINKYINLPFKKLWYPHYFKYTFPQNRPLCVVLLTPHIPNDYLKYIKSKYPNSKVVAIHRDLVVIWKKTRPEFVQNPLFDLELSYDIGDCETYGMVHFDELESKIDVPISPEGPTSDVFFAGKAKDRLDRLVRAYDRFASAGLKCLFYIVGVPKEKQISRPGIIYSNKQLSYRQLLFHTVNSRCILEISQENASGYSARFLEAVLYNKRLITDNLWIKNSKFYRPDYIDCIESVDAINPAFVTDFSGQVDYCYNGEFSPVALIDLIDRELIKKFGEIAN